MSLYQRLSEVQGGAGAAPGGSAPESPAAQAQQPAAAAQPAGDNPVQELRKRVHGRLIDELGSTLDDSDMPESELKQLVMSKLEQAVADERVPLSAADKQRLIQSIANDVLGYGPIDPLLHDESVSEIMVNGPNQVYVERGGKAGVAPVQFLDSDHLRRVIEKIVAQVGRRIDESSPLCDARLPDGSRVNAVIPPLAIGGPFLTIRKFSTDPLGIEDLIGFGTLSPASARFLQACIVGKLNVIISGGTGSGKTTTLNVMSSFIPEGERVITIEDAKELQLRQDHVLCMESRPPNVEGKGEVSIRDLVKNSLRMRPDRIVVGECRGGEALDMLQAMNTGHDGSLTTVHANKPRDAMTRIETLTMMAGYDLPIKAIREQMSSAVDLVIQIGRQRDGSRKISHITEVQGMEGDVIILQDIFLFDFGAGVGEDGKLLGTLQPTGVRPKFAEKLADHGIKLGAEVFTPGRSTL
ncbi:MAG: CpaF family protein [Acidimicrobiales bacterium]